MVSLEPLLPVFILFMVLCIIGCGIRAYFVFLEIKESKKQLRRILKHSPFMGLFTFQEKCKE